MIDNWQYKIRAVYPIHSLVCMGEVCRRLGRLRLYSSGFNRARDRGVWFQPRPGSSNESGFDQIFDRTLAAGWIVEKRAFSPLGDRIWDTAPMSAQNWLKISLPSGSVVLLSG